MAEIVGPDPVDVVPRANAHHVDPVIHGGVDVTYDIAVLADGSEDPAHLSSHDFAIPVPARRVSACRLLPGASYSRDSQESSRRPWTRINAPLAGSKSGSRTSAYDGPGTCRRSPSACCAVRHRECRRW